MTEIYLHIVARMADYITTIRSSAYLPAGGPFVHHALRPLALRLQARNERGVPLLQARKAYVRQG